MNYSYTIMEDFIKKIYKNIGINHPNQLDIESIDSRIVLVVNYYDGSSMYAFKQFF